MRRETVASVALHAMEDFNPEDATFGFTAWAHCTHPHCKQDFAIAGSGGVAPEFVSKDDWEYEDYFTPLLCHPMPDMITIPRNCPDDVRSELRLAFGLFWLSPAACASRIRVTLELLMNHLGVPRRRRDGRGGSNELDLHTRINAFAKRHLDAGAQMMALKWLGNAGSHGRQINREDILAALEIMENVLSEIIERRSGRIARLTRKLTHKHRRR